MLNLKIINIYYSWKWKVFTFLMVKIQHRTAL
jgi:hypothetical protein